MENSPQPPSSTPPLKTPSIKENRVRKIAPLYYSRKDIITTLHKFSENREISPRYFEGFGKRPDIFQYPSDVSMLVKKGATSFHCSEEIWQDPTELSTDLSQEQIDNLRTGWDLIIDIDCPWIDYSKKAAIAIIKALEYRGVNNVGIKFSGSKGFHIIVPWNAFPKEVNGIETKKMFPSWPRAIVNYLKDLSRPILAHLIKDEKNDFTKQKDYTGVKCETCNNLSSENFEINLRCPSCNPPYIETFRTHTKEYKEKKCPTCNNKLIEKDSKKFYYCSHCEFNSLENPDNFNEEIISMDIFKILGLDVLLVSSRHLFRMPYSLHEKTGLASVVIDKNKIEDFELKHADPLNAKTLLFTPESIHGEAENLLIQAIDFDKTQEREKPKLKFKSNQNPYQNNGKEFEPIKITEIKEENFPPVIQKILVGMQDGRKRALFILMNFFKSLGMTMEDIEKKLNEWNKKNKPLLKQGYINSQLVWHSKNKPVLPPNFDNPIYKELGIYEMDHLSSKVKNPVNYVVRKAYGDEQRKKEAERKAKRKKKKK